MSGCERSMQNANSERSVTALILAGGKSRRMGRDKRLLVFKGQPLIGRAIDSVRPLTPRVFVLISNPQDAEFISPLISSKVNFLADREPGAGPLGALVSASPSVATDYAFLLAADFPKLAGEFILRMWNWLKQCQPLPQALLPLAGGFPQVACAFYHRTLISKLSLCFEQGERSLVRCLRKHSDHLQYLPEECWRSWADGAVFHNVNTPEDFQRLEEG